MSETPSFDKRQRALQGAWFAANLAPHHGYGGKAYRVSPEQRQHNLAPGLQEIATRLFAAIPVIQWHKHANHALSSQVCCVNFLLPFADKPALLGRWIEHVTGDVVAQVLPVEKSRGGQDWFVTFEWVGDVDYLNEARANSIRNRGANATAADAAVRYRTADGRTVLLLIEWKYTERYGQPLSPSGNPTRRLRYDSIFREPNGPIRSGADVTLDDFFYEPLYQMLRQQMLAWRNERHNPDIDRARVLHISPRDNRALHAVTSPTLRRFGGDVFDVFRSLLGNPDDFRSISIEAAFTPLAHWPEATWYPWLQDRYASLYSTGVHG